MLKVGQTVTVYNRTLSGRPIIEGRALLIGRGVVPEQFLVEFEDTGETCLRFIFDGECQTDPKSYIEKVQAEYAAQVS